MMNLTNTDDITSLFESDDTMQLLVGALANRMRELLDEHDSNALHFQQPFNAIQDMVQSAVAGDTTMIDIDRDFIGEGGSRRLSQVTVTFNEE